MKENEFQPYQMSTRDGRVDFAQLENSTFTIKDVAVGLAGECRYNSHIEGFYSVASHSIIMAAKCLEDLGNPDLALFCLLHDAPEAFMRDIPSPLKKLLPSYQRIEDELFSHIMAFSGVVITREKMDYTKSLDRKMYFAERVYLHGWEPDTDEDFSWFEELHTPYKWGEASEHFIELNWNTGLP